MATTANHQAVPCTISARRASMLCLYCSLAAVCSRKLHSTPSAIVLYCAACCSARVSCSCKSTTHQIYLRQQPMSAAPANLQHIKSTFVNNSFSCKLSNYSFCIFSFCSLNTLTYSVIGVGNKHGEWNGMM